MNYTRVLHAFRNHPHTAVMPVDLAMCLSLSRRQPLNQLLSAPPPKPAQRYWQPTDYLPKTSLHSPHHSSAPSSSWLAGSSAVPSEPRSCFRRDGGSAGKKRVVFADAKGLALTAVRLFISEPSSPTSPLVMKPSLAKLQGLASGKLPRHKFRLGFPQPTQDFKAFLARLRESRVQLESCHISEQSLSGKVCVSHDSIEKAVHIKVTFDSWRSHHDIPCTFLQQQRCWGSDMGVFTFDLSLPQNTDPKERIEFCVYFRPGPGATPHWDDNRGQNYTLCVDKGPSDANQGDANQGYPALTQHRPTSWPSRTQNSVELQIFQRGLSSRDRAEWKTLCSAK
ncbi:LOW QUALITY PROTEIN: protein phosphatase 1 regulatory subunit 3C-B [Scophthalmus maximus]|uniref:LOW QUALITY PROTEIN: protein phosphatase 1 regulatory subunit 3C-B n=1 Tax=Scophthalmus maximus TaxID=52904 RepID=UPI001FA91404|nr:LOW QUALITY PROTEIN: protein phosphatase 1 regulatory subunit 3C-B [Scophthalmus maximus]